MLPGTSPELSPQQDVDESESDDDGARNRARTATIGSSTRLVEQQRMAPQVRTNRYELKLTGRTPHTRKEQNCNEHPQQSMPGAKLREPGMLEAVVRAFYYVPLSEARVLEFKLLISPRCTDSRQQLRQRDSVQGWYYS
jgi:hypothetical protein